jgi:raffinose/stachyose/melibiose transport system permease protein
MEVRAVVHEPADLGTTDVTAPGAGVNRTGPPPVMALPALAYFGVFALLPLGGVVMLGLMRWDGIGDPSWAGLSR